MMDEDLDKQTGRFRVRHNEGDRFFDPHWEIVDTQTGEVIGGDGGAPEDQLLVRDWAWVREALNAVDTESRARIADLEREKAALHEAMVEQERTVAACRADRDTAYAKGDV